MMIKGGMKAFGLVALLGVLAACEPTVTAPEKPKGPDIQIIEASRKLDTTTVLLRYKNGSAIPPADYGRAMAQAMTIACLEGESPIADTTMSENGILRANVFCTQVLTTDQVVDGSGFVGS